MVKVGVVGLGSMGENHVRLYKKLNCELMGVVDENPERARQTGEKYGIPSFTDYHDLLPKVEAVTIAVPTTIHQKICGEFLKAGIHCLVEKPIASNLDEAENMIAAAEKNHAILAIGHIEQFNPAVQILKKMLDEGSLGQPLIISTRRVGPYVPRIRDVGIVVDSATHDIGVINYLLGALPRSVFARMGSLKHNKEDYALLMLDYGKASAAIEVNWFTPYKVRTLVVTGSEGIAYLDYIEQKLVVHNNEEIKMELVKKTEPLKVEMEDFLNSIKNGSKPGVNGKDALEILKIATFCNNNVCTWL